MANYKATTQKGDRCSNTAKDDSDYCYIKSHQAQGGNEEHGLNPRQEKFCQLYVSEEFFANGTQSYIEAYNKAPTNKREINVCAAAASRLLSKVKIFDRINDLLDEAGLNDNFVDKELLFLISQHSDYKSKLGAIREYNKLKQRITDKIDHTSSDGSMTPQTLDDFYSQMHDDPDDESSS